MSEHIKKKGGKTYFISNADTPACSPFEKISVEELENKGSSGENALVVYHCAPGNPKTSLLEIISLLYAATKKYPNLMTVLGVHGEADVSQIDGETWLLTRDGVFSGTEGFIIETTFLLISSCVIETVFPNLFLGVPFFVAFACCVHASSSYRIFEISNAFTLFVAAASFTLGVAFMTFETVKYVGTTWGDLPFILAVIPIGIPILLASAFLKICYEGAKRATRYFLHSA